MFIQENAFENVVCEMSAILSRPQCVKTSLRVHSGPGKLFFKKGGLEYKSTVEFPE